MIVGGGSGADRSGRTVWRRTSARGWTGVSSAKPTMPKLILTDLSNSVAGIRDMQNAAGNGLAPHRRFAPRRADCGAARSRREISSRLTRWAMRTPLSVEFARHDAATVRHAEAGAVRRRESISTIRNPGCTARRRSEQTALQQLRHADPAAGHPEQPPAGHYSAWVRRDRKPRIHKADLQLLGAVASQTGLALENAELTENIRQEIAQRERLDRELEIAREVQQRLFPQTLPVVQGLDFAGYCRPARGRGRRLLRLYPSAGRVPGHRDRRRFGQRNRGRSDDGQPAGVAARTDDQALRQLSPR